MTSWPGPLSVLNRHWLRGILHGALIAGIVYALTAAHGYFSSTPELVADYKWIVLAVIYGFGFIFAFARIRALEAAAARQSDVDK